MTIAIAVLTWNRLQSLTLLLDGLRDHCPNYDIAVFEDCGFKDGTADYLRQYSHSGRIDKSVLAEVRQSWKHPKETYFLGTANVGVAGNSNRALAWYRSTGADYLMLCNDDLVVSGDFAAYYASVMTKTGVGLLCCSPRGGHYTYDAVYSGGIKFKVVHRMAGGMMAMSRALVDRLGFFDTRFGRFGQEHCDWTIRAEGAGFQCLNGKHYSVLDIEQNLVQYSGVVSSMINENRAKADAIAQVEVDRLSYHAEGLYRGYSITPHEKANGIEDVGLAVAALGGVYHVGCQAHVAV